MAKRILILLVLAAALVAPDELSSCGPFLPLAMFAGKTAPIDEARFFAGKLDILQPQYWRIYQIVAYRYLAGVGLTPEDQQALLTSPSVPDYWGGADDPAIQGWMQARAQVGAPALQPINRFKMLPDYAIILGCGDDAFRNASATLIARGRSGAAHDDLRAWVAAQDQVFTNCAGPQRGQPDQQAAAPSIPPMLPPGAAGWMQADRTYQIAAAEFYAGEFDTAAAEFRRIAEDHGSPWHQVAPYLAARALIRKATIVDPKAAVAAQEQLGRVLADADASPWHESARGLARYLRARTDPDGALGELAHIAATQGANAAGALNDYRLMLDHYLDRGKPAPRDADITDWIMTMRADADGHALEKWRATHSLPWLVAALTNAGEADAELMAAAAQVPKNSPGFLTVEFHRLRLLGPEDARRELDAMPLGKLPAPARNLFLASRMRVARDWGELLRSAARTVAATGSGYDHDMMPSAATGKRYFDADAARILDRQAPLAILRQAVDNQALPPNLQAEIARAVWVRAILLNDTATATGVAPGLATRAAYLKPYLDGYVSATDGKARNFAAIWLLLNNPGMRPSITAGAWRQTSVPVVSTFRDNWWCPAGVASFPATEGSNAPLELLYRGSEPEARFASKEERAAVEKERERQAAAPGAVSFMARQAVEWVEGHTDDGRAPEVLRLVVRAGHYACSDGDNEADRWIKRAFELLHSRYAQSTAAKSTPYWFKVGSR